MSYSGGKDSALALYRMVQKGHILISLLVTVNKDLGVSWFHGVDVALLRAVAESFSAYLILVESDGKDYETALADSLKEAGKMGATAVVFGDIDIDEHRVWCERVAAAADLEAVFPLWQEDRLLLVNEVIDAGFSSIIKVVSKNSGLHESLLGKKLTKETLNEIIRCGADPCGENGEYHTFVYNGPAFHRPVPFKTDGIYENEYCYGLKIRPLIGETGI